MCEIDGHDVEKASQVNVLSVLLSAQVMGLQGNQFFPKTFDVRKKKSSGVCRSVGLALV